MADLYDAVSRVVQGMLARKKPKAFQPGKILEVHENGSYSVSVNGAPPVVSVPAGDFPIVAGDPVWVAASYTPGKWVPAKWTPTPGTYGTEGTLTPGFLLPGFLVPAQNRPVILGKLVD